MRLSDGSLLRSRFTLLSTGVSLFALAAAPAQAQTEQPADISDTAGQVQQTDEAPAPESSVANATAPAEPEGGTIVVTGIRQSLRNSQNIKRNADTVVDAITATDIGALPDRSVTEALQRVPGVQINRFAAASDPDHFSAEGSGVVIRGLSFVRSEFNGRDTFSTGVYGQAINFADVPAELLGSVEVYKNSTAEMIEGGLSGTVNMNLRLPFDRKGLHWGFDVEANYSDLANKWSPVGSALVSNNWDTNIGRVGFMAAGAYSRLLSRSDGVQVTNFQLRNGTVAGNSDTDSNGSPDNFCRMPLPSDTDATGFPPVLAGAAPNAACFGTATGSSDGFADWIVGDRYAPLGGQYRTQDYDRRRKGFAGALQWESTDRTMAVTAQVLRSAATQKWGEHTFEAAPDLAEYNTFPIGCLQNANGPGGRTQAECPVGQFTNYQYGDDGVFESGYITAPGTGWRAGDTGQAIARIPTGGIQNSLSRRSVDEYNRVQDHGLNFKYTPNERWSFNVDAQHVRAKHDNLDLSVFGSNYADYELDLTGGVPDVIAHKPNTLFPTWGTASPDLIAATDEQYFADPRFTFWRAAMDHKEKSRGREWAFKGDVTYNFEDASPFLKRVKFGARYSDRDQLIKSSAYNWGALSEAWSGSPTFMDQVGGGNVELYNYRDFFRGETSAPPSANYYAGDPAGDYDDTVNFLRQIQEVTRASGSSAVTWNPLAERSGVRSDGFLPGEVQRVSEANKAAYAMLSFDSDNPIFGNVRVAGNIGLRYVTSKVKSLGSIGVPTQQALGLLTTQGNLIPFTTDPAIVETNPATGVTAPIPGRCDPRVPEGAPPGTIPAVPGGICTVGAAAYNQLAQFATGETADDLARNDYSYFLPSLNLRFGLTDNLILRFAAGRNLARPGLADIRNFLTLGQDSSNGFRLTATAGNPYLKPALSDNLDASLEWYFARVGSLTFNAFAKNIHNFFYQEVTERPITSGGVTQPVFVRGPANFDGKGKIRGFEVAYQQTFDMLPGVLSGLGVAANYTYIKSKGLPVQNTFRQDTGPLGRVGSLPLEQLSKHNINFAPFYEKGPLSLRLAYNWRSKYLLTSSDVIFPYYPIYNDKGGQIDASAFYSITDKLKIGVQGVNLNNQVTKTLQQFAPGMLGPRSYFMNDRRFSFILRGSF
ncbi:TonB-dependent receptor [Sphingomonas piscis]|uniref:TonB-dependent receptor n=1 Tax=Sphingomonas piscis TaxID=2714943 RepID=A0A6G7YM86_9SPHN|nr:TonB-dependent receptor [Sphingomonas piscis]QIK77860.1 TonB-dependent receptor [Sphingomonas piscis]